MPSLTKKPVNKLFYLFVIVNIIFYNKLPFFSD